MYELQICTRKGALLRSFALGDRQEVIIGRDESCDVRIDSKAVSREHCAIESRNGEMFVRDLGSTGGTFINGRRIERLRLEDGVEIQVGPAVLKFYDAGL